MTESWAYENSQGSLLRNSQGSAPMMVAGGEASGSAGRLASASVTSPAPLPQASGPSGGLSSPSGMAPRSGQTIGVQPTAQGAADAAVEVNPFVSAFFDSLAAYGFHAETQGFIVETLDGKVLAEHNADHPFNPASVVKVATSLTAISKLGADYRFRTMLYTDGYLEPATGTLHGSLYVMGTGDPVFFPENALLIADQLNRHGIRIIDGNLVVEGKFYFAFSASREASAKALRAAMMPESPNFTQSAAYLQFLSMRAAEQDRSRMVFGDPIRTVAPGQDPAPAQPNSANPRNTDSSGRQSGASGSGATVQAAATATYLPPAGVPYLKVTGETLTQGGINTTNLKLLAVHTSLPLIRVLKGQNDFSNNWMATMIGEMVGGPDAVDKFLEDAIGLQGDEIRIVTSSGLGSNYISPRAMALIMRKLIAYLNKQNIGLEELLPVAGIDHGTLERRFTDAYRGSVVAKTGTLHAVSALAGVAYTRGRGPLIFVIFNHGGSPYSFRGAQDETVKKVITLCGGPAPPRMSSM